MLAPSILLSWRRMMAATGSLLPPPQRQQVLLLLRRRLSSQKKVGLLQCPLWPLSRPWQHHQQRLLHPHLQRLHLPLRPSRLTGNSRLNQPRLLRQPLPQRQHLRPLTVAPHYRLRSR